MKPTTHDFLVYLPWSANISETLINPHIEDAYKFDIKPKVETLAIDIYNLKNNGTKPELYAFYDQYFCQWWVFLAFRRFIQIHGRNITQFGYTKTRDPEGTFDQVDASERAVILKQLTSDAALCFTWMLKQTWTFDGTTYRKNNDTDCGPRYGEGYGINVLD
jgi:hypothetical protein